MPTVATGQEEQNVIVCYWHAAHNYKKYCSIPQQEQKILSLQTKQLQHPACCCKHTADTQQRQQRRGRLAAEGLPACGWHVFSGPQLPRTRAWAAPGQQQWAPTWAPAAKPCGIGENGFSSLTNLSVPALRCQLLSYLAVSNPLQMVFNKRLARGSQASDDTQQCCYNQYNSSPMTVSSRSTVYYPHRRQQAHKFMVSALPHPPPMGCQHKAQSHQLQLSLSSAPLLTGM